MLSSDISVCALCGTLFTVKSIQSTPPLSEWFLCYPVIYCYVFQVPLPFKFPTETLHVFLLHTRHTSHLRQDLPIVVLSTHFLTKILYMFLISPYEPCIAPALSWIIPSSGLSRGVRWLDTDVSGPPIGPIFKGQAVEDRLTPRNNPQDGRIQFNRSASQNAPLLVFPLEMPLSVHEGHAAWSLLLWQSNGVTLLAVSRWVRLFSSTSGPAIDTDSALSKCSS